MTRESTDVETGWHRVAPGWHTEKSMVSLLQYCCQEILPDSAKMKHETTYAKGHPRECKTCPLESGWGHERTLPDRGNQRDIKPCATHAPWQHPGPKRKELLLNGVWGWSGGIVPMLTFWLVGLSGGYVEKVLVWRKHTLGYLRVIGHDVYSCFKWFRKWLVVMGIDKHR